MIEKYGLSKYIEDSDSILIHKDTFGELYEKEINNDESIVMVKVINSTAETDGSFKNYFLRVPPECKTAKEAVAWTFGIESNQYEPQIET